MKKIEDLSEEAQAIVTVTALERIMAELEKTMSRYEQIAQYCKKTEIYCNVYMIDIVQRAYYERNRIADAIAELDKKISGRFCREAADYMETSKLFNSISFD